MFCLVQAVNLVHHFGSCDDEPAHVSAAAAAQGMAGRAGATGAKGAQSRLCTPAAVAPGTRMAFRRFTGSRLSSRVQRYLRQEGVGLCAADVPAAVVVCRLRLLKGVCPPQRPPRHTQHWHHNQKRKLGQACHQMNHTTDLLFTPTHAAHKSLQDMAALTAPSRATAS
jgi:hypothetical protein